jgi:hypothetical protein
MSARNQLAALINDPSSFENDPSYQFARNQGLEATSRGNSAQRGSGNALAALMRYGSGLATQGYNARVDSLGRIAGQDQQYELGMGANQNTANRNANDLTLGTAQNQTTRDLGFGNLGLGFTRAGIDYSLGREQNANTRQRNSNDFSLARQRNFNDYGLGRERNSIDRQNNRFTYDLGMGRNFNDYQSNQTQRDLGLGRNTIDAYDAQTRRGSVNATNQNNQQRNALGFLSRRTG